MSPTLGRYALISLCLILFSWIGSAAAQTARSAADAGRRLYEQGITTNGSPLKAQWPGGVTLSGEAAACVQCHRLSGMGMWEGSVLVPPVTGFHLFEPRPAPATGPRRAEGMVYEDHHFNSRPPYDRRTLARALQQGVTPSGHRMAFLMPRYALGAQDLRALEAHLRGLSVKPSPGTSENLAHFATVLTPGAAKTQHREVVEVLSACFRERFPPDRAAGMRWQLHVWELQGPVQDWPRQLNAHMARQPVFALVSGMGGADWAPVHQFCESAAVPCLFPNVDAPGGPTPAHNTFYFSEGTRLEGAILAKWLRDSSATPVLQFLAPDSDAGRIGADALRRHLPGRQIEDRVIDRFDADGLRAVLGAVTPDTTVVFWLNREQFQRVVAASPTAPSAQTLIASGWMTDAENWLDATSWRERLVMSYLLDAPGRRELRMRFNLRPWLIAQEIGAGDEVVLGNTLAACNLLTESWARMRGILRRDYLLEMIESYPSAMGNAPASQAFANFSLGTGQRVSSKGGAIVRFAGPSGKSLTPVKEWLLP